MSAKFTPGPWQWVTHKACLRLRAIDVVGCEVDVVEPFTNYAGNPDIDASRADMHLIAAAPEMYWLLRRAYVHLNTHGAALEYDIKSIIARIDGDEDD